MASTTQSATASPSICAASTTARERDTQSGGETGSHFAAEPMAGGFSARHSPNSPRGIRIRKDFAA